MAAQLEGERTEQRFVRSEDPSLTPEANRLLTRELREVIGAETVAVRGGTPAHARAHGTRRPLAAHLVANRQILLITLATAIVVGVFLSLVTGSWWALVAAVAIHALATTAVAGGVIRLAALTEHVSPAVAARLEAEGVADPDRVLTRLVEEFSGTATAGARAPTLRRILPLGAAIALGVAIFMVGMGFLVHAL